MAEKVEVLPNGTVLFEYGPMRMFIQASEGGRPLVELAKDGAHRAKELLDELARFLSVIKRKSLQLEVEERFPDVVRRMIDATRRMEEPDLTPLASVAGAASDVVADFMIGKGGTKIIVDNGGDIAVRLKGKERATIGVKTEIDASRPAYILSIDPAMEVGGIATSGLGGRSFTKGIASAATVLSANASLADAGATVIGNFTNVEHPGIARSPAETIYPDTDIAGEWVTVEVGELPEKEIEEAVSRGIGKADAIRRKGLIKGALVAVKGRVGWTESLNSWLTRL